MIEKYSFGKIVINGRIYTNDVIICPDKVIEKWWRKSVHYLNIEDIQNTIERENPQIVVIGTGKFALMKVSPDVKNYLKHKEIEYYIKSSGKAVEIYNKKKEDTDKAIGAFHLTC
ncbi:MAG: MTH938/NDUFAF3 family protein [bacterium]